MILSEQVAFSHETISFPPAVPESTTAAVVHLSGQMPSNCAVVANHFKSKGGGQIDEVAPSRRVGLPNVLQSLPDPVLGETVFVLGSGQVANVGLIARPNAVAPGLPPEDCELEGILTVTRIDNGGMPLEVPYEGDSLAFLPDVTDAESNPVLPGDTGNLYDHHYQQRAIRRECPPAV